MNYVGSIDYLNRGFLNGQLQINPDASRLRELRGDIKSFSLNGTQFTVELQWLVGRSSPSDAWGQTDEPLVYEFDMLEWSDRCHGEGRIGLTKQGVDAEFLIVPRRHRSCIEPIEAAK